MNFTSGLPVSRIASALTWYGSSSLMRSSQTSLGSPIETQTSVSRKSQPLTASATSSVTVILPAARGGELVRGGEHLLGRPQRPRGRDPHVHAELGAADQVGVGHVEARVAEVAERDLAERLVHVLAEGQEVGQDLRRVPLVGEAVVDGDACPLGELVGDALAEAAVLDRVIHAPEHSRGVLDGLLVTDVRAGRPEVGHVRALVVGGDLERAPGAGRVLLEDQRDLLAAQVLLLAALPSWPPSAPPRGRAGR